MSLWVPQCGGGRCVNTQCHSRMTWADKDAGANTGTSTEEGPEPKRGESGLGQKDRSG